MEEPSALLSFAVISGLIGLNGFFVASEFALVSVRRSRVEELSSLGNRRAKALLHSLDDLDRHIAGTQVGITLASLALGWLGEPLIARWVVAFFHSLEIFSLSAPLIHSISFGIAFIAITVLHVVLGELVPKSLALQRSETVALLISRPMYWVVIILNPLIWVLNGIGNRILRFLGMPPSGSHQNIHSVEELQILVEQSHEAGVLDETERGVLQRSFRFSELTAKDIMVRRIDMAALDREDSVEVNLEKAVESIYSRLPVYQNSLDNIVGILCIQDVCRAYHRKAMPKDILELCRPVFAVPESIHLDDLLEFFRVNRTHLVVVVDEHGGTAGIVAFADIVEEVTGEIENEFEGSENYPQYLPDKRIIIRGDMRIDELNSALGWNLQADLVDTVAGLVMYHLGRVARVDDEVPTEFGVLKVIDMARMRITKVAVVPKEEGESTASE